MMFMRLHWGKTDEDAALAVHAVPSSTNDEPSLAGELLSLNFIPGRFRDRIA
jgi:hypothetical protein